MPELLTTTDFSDGTAGDWRLSKGSMSGPTLQAVDVATKDYAGGRYRLATTLTTEGLVYWIPVPKDTLTRGMVLSAEVLYLSEPGPLRFHLVPMFGAGVDANNVLGDPPGTTVESISSTAALTLQTITGLEIPGPGLHDTYTYTSETGVNIPGDWRAETVTGAALVVSATGTAAWDVDASKIGLVTASADYLGAAPEPEPEPEAPAEPTPTEGPSPTVAAFLGRPDDAKVIALAEVHYPIMAEYVRGYTNGRGFYIDGTPEPGVAAVLITATARSVMNPESLSYFTMGDYSERPALTAGWTLHELGVLRRYRRLTNREV